MRGRIYLKNAALLTASGLALRLFGMLFRVIIAGRLGSEGMGLYQLVLAVYMVFVSLASAGVNVASTRFAAEALAKGHSLARCRLSLVTVAALFGGVAMLAQYLLAAPLSALALHDIRAELGLRVLAPSLPFIAVAGALRGCFLAQRNVLPNVISQFVEQLVRLGVALCALEVLAAWGPGYACAAVLIGNSVSESVSCLLMVLFTVRSKRHEPKPLSSETDGKPPFTAKELGGIVLPVGATRVLGSALQAAESSLLPQCLTVYLGTRSLAVAQYGDFKGMALPLVFFPFSVLAALSGLLMPEITRAHALHDKTATVRLVRITMQLTGAFSVAAGILLLLFGQRLAGLLYSEPQVGEYVRVLGLCAPFMYLESMVDGILKGLGEQMATFRYSVCNAVLRILGILWIVPQYGMRGFLCIMVASNIISCTMNTVRMVRVINEKEKVGIKPEKKAERKRRSHTKAAPAK